ncbi:hypothetical protein [Streptomyces sp. NPDC055085]
MDEWINHITLKLAACQERGFNLTKRGIARNGLFEWTFHCTDKDLVRYVVVAISAPGNGEKVEVWASAENSEGSIRFGVFDSVSWNPWNIDDLATYVEEGREFATRFKPSDLTTASAEETGPNDETN